MDPKDKEFWWIKRKVIDDITVGECWRLSDTEYYWWIPGNEIEAQGNEYETISKIERPKINAN